MTEAATAFEALAEDLLAQPDVDEGTGFGSMPGLRTNGKIFAMLFEGDLVLKLPADRCAALIDAGGAEAFQMGRRKMREWVRIGRVDAPEWLALATEARRFVGGQSRR